MTTPTAIAEVSAPRRTRDVPMVAGQRRFAAGRFDNFAFIRDTNPDSIGFDVYDLMRRYPAIHSALVLRKAPILSQIKRAQVRSDDEARRAFLDRVLVQSGLLFRLAVTSLRAMDFGIAAHEIQWQVETLDITYESTDEFGTETEETAWSGPAITVREFHEVNPVSIKKIRRRTEPQGGKPGDGSYDGFVQRGAGNKPDEIVIEAVDSFLHTFGLEYGNLWGTPITRNAYPYFFWANAAWKLYMAWAEKKVIPPRIVYYPVGENLDPVTGETIDNALIAIKLGSDIDAVTAVAIPGDADPLTGKRAWEIEEKPITDRTDTFEKIIGALDRAMLEAIFMPERAYKEAQFGTRAEAERHTDTLLMVDQFDLDRLLSDVNRFVVPRLLEANFEGEGSAEITVPGLTDDERSMLLNVFTMLVTNPEFAPNLDFRRMAETLGVPLAEIEPEEPLDEEPLDETEEPVDTGADTTDAAGNAPNVVLSLEEFDAVIEEGIRALLDQDAGKVSSVLDLLDRIQLAADVDLSQYTITPDTSSILGYKVMKGDRRITGFAAKQVIKSFKNQAQKRQKQAESAARKAATAARVAANKAKRDAEAAARRQTSDARRKAREAAAAERKAQAAERRAAREEQTKQRQAASAQRRTDREAATATRRQQQADTRAAKEADRAEADRVKEAERDDEATISTARSEKSRIESDTRKLASAEADAKVKAAGWDSEAKANDRQAALDRANAAAKKNPDRVYSIVQTKDGFTVISKPKEAIKKARSDTARNIAADDEPADPDGFDASTPDDVADALIARASRTIASLFRERDPSDPDDEPDDE